jgi:hypothetical protein
MTEADLTAQFEEQAVIIDQLLAADPSLNPITAHIMAGDIQSAAKATELVNAGTPATKAYAYVGSYARWDWVVTMVKAGAIPGQWFAENICELWRGADPDDTNPDYLRIWRTAFVAHGAYLRDGRPLPRGRFLTIFRGGLPNAVRDGFAWTTDPKIAHRFAVTGGGRQPVKGGVIATGTVDRRAVMAYITERGESEVIVDPLAVKVSTVVPI